MINISLKAKIKGHILLCRPFAWLWFVFLTCTTFGCILLNHLIPITYLQLIIIVILTDSASTTINDVGDIEVDRFSLEPSRRNRPLVAGIVSKNAAILQGILLYVIALLLAAEVSDGVFFMILGCALYSSAYSLNPIKLSGRPLSSVVFWPLLWLGYYFLNICFLEKINICFAVQFFPEFFQLISEWWKENKTIFDCIDRLFITKLPSYQLLYYGGNILTSIAGLTYLTSIIFFMGLGEIMAKDLRDFYNDKLGGRNTFTNTMGLKKISYFMPITAFIGLIFWAATFYCLHKSTNLFSILCLIVGFVWCFRIIYLLICLNRNYKPLYCIALHKQWITTYIIMQLLTILSFV